MIEYIDDKLGLAHDARAVFLKVLKKLGLYKIPIEKMEHFTSFDEYPSCEMCNSSKDREVLIANDGCRIVECVKCGLWYTSPRIQEGKWIEWLSANDTNRNKVLTENRIRYGVAMPRNIKLTRSGWFKRHKKEYIKIIDIIKRHSEKTINRLHDVGCGIGLFLLTCRDKGIRASGNEINEYAVKIMNDRFGLNIFNQVLGEVPLPAESIDAISMNAYIEHTYHPLDDLLAAYRFLKKGGIIYVSTFHTDSIAYDKLGNNWDMFEWNHVYHFSSMTLEKMIKKAGFQIKENNMKYEIPVSYIVGEKI